MGLRRSQNPRAWLHRRWLIGGLTLACMLLGVFCPEGLARPSHQRQLKGNRARALRTLTAEEIRACLIGVPLYCGVDAENLVENDGLPTVFINDRLENFGQRAQGLLIIDESGSAMLTSRKSRARRCLKANNLGQVFFAIGWETRTDSCFVPLQDTKENVIQCYALQEGLLTDAVHCLKKKLSTCDDKAPPPNSNDSTEDLNSARFKAFYPELSCRVQPHAPNPPPKEPESASSDLPHGSWRGQIY